MRLEHGMNLQCKGHLHNGSSTEIPFHNRLRIQTHGCMVNFVWGMVWLSESENVLDVSGPTLSWSYYSGQIAVPVCLPCPLSSGKNTALVSSNRHLNGLFLFDLTDNVIFVVFLLQFIMNLVNDITILYIVFFLNHIIYFSLLSI